MIKNDKIIDILIISYNRIEYLKRCLKSVEDFSKDVNYQLIISDPGSKDGSREWLFKNYSEKATLIFENRRWSYAQSVNNGFRYGRSKYCVTLNEDCEATENWLSNALRVMEKDDTIGHGAFVVLRADRNKIMSAGANVNHCGTTVIPLMDKKYNDPKDRDRVFNHSKYNLSNNYAYAGFGVYRRDLLERLGYLPEFPVVIYFDDTDYCMKVNAIGYDVRLIPDSVIVHFVVHSGREQHEKSARIGRTCFNQRWGAFLKENGGYSPPDRLGNKIRPHINGEYIFSEEYKPLGFPVDGKPREISEVENTWM